jgi:hypothetical protein
MDIELTEHTSLGALPWWMGEDALFLHPIAGASRSFSNCAPKLMVSRWTVSAAEEQRTVIAKMTTRSKPRLSMTSKRFLPARRQDRSTPKDVWEQAGVEPRFARIPLLAGLKFCGGAISAFPLEHDEPLSQF